MSNQGLDLSKHASPARRHQLSRSITELSAPIRLHRHHQLHHQLHQRRQPSRDDGTLQPVSLTIQSPRASLDLPRSEGVTPYTMSTDQSRRTSMLPPGAEELGALAAAAVVASRERQLHEERSQAASRTAGLRKTLTDLTAFSNATTRRLDESYYAILEKLSMLQNTILVLKELAGMAQNTDDTFKADSQGLIIEVESQLNAVGHFDEQEKRIASLQYRIFTGRQRAQKLSERVDLVRERVEGWARVDKDWQERTRKRLKVIWVITSVMVLAIMFILFGVQYTRSNMDVSRETNLASMSKQAAAIDEVSANSSRVSDQLSEDLRAALDSTRGDGTSTEEVFRAFDEL
ncbi:uncharacterized protein BCR38DRAFT_484025 [Pseudomassariella vexata]|uniref:Uncharacterized protein n=1 Tax=Pseudomassariella vexata TaxID=1141098 RepID=A0A1Y2E4E7_9PEZI|nr:uncharacterized protein BCR38DRAFT_484025 [Pseudomassariella vexata]ORY66389.1 hypothetical protein BCR38DRAFT_484025 [Pseudomassariella vexata]